MTVFPLMGCRLHAASALLLCFAAQLAHADSYTFPADLNDPPFNCTGSGGNYNCPAISLSKATIITLTSSVTLNVAGGFSTAKEFTTSNHGYTLTLVVSGPASFQKDLNAEMNLTAAGPVTIAKDGYIKGNVTAAGNLTVAKDSLIDGNVVVSGNLNLGHNSDITGTCQVSGSSN